MRGRTTRDDGASLMIVLVFMTLIGVITLSLLDLVSASFQGTDAVRQARQQHNAADAALEIGIRKVVTHPASTLGTPGGPTCDFTLENLNGLTTRIRCSSDGSAGSGGGRAENAVLSLVGDISVTGNAPITIGGRVHSAARLTTGQPQNVVTVETSVTAPADGDCSDTTKVKVPTSLRYCSATPPPPTTALGVDPNWLPAATSFSAGGLTGCSTSAGGIRLATFAPGKYSVSPTALLSGSSCSKRDVLVFAKGTYYFEDVVFNTSAYSVAAGALGDWASDASSTTVPTRMLCDATAVGVQFVLGGSARIEVPNEDTNFSLCAGPGSSTQPAIALFGAKAAPLQPLTNSIALRTAKKPSLFVDGAMYTPTSGLDLQMHNRSKTYLSGGLVAGRILMNVNASSTQLDSPISLPACTSAAPCKTDRRVVITASIGDVDRVRAVVAFDDSAGASPTSPYVVESWNVLR